MRHNHIYFYRTASSHIPCRILSRSPARWAQGSCYLMPDQSQASDRLWEFAMQHQLPWRASSTGKRHAYQSLGHCSSLVFSLFSVHKILIIYPKLLRVRMLHGGNSGSTKAASMLWTGCLQDLLPELGSFPGAMQGCFVQILVPFLLFSCLQSRSSVPCTVDFTLLVMSGANNRS